MVAVLALMAASDAGVAAPAEDPFAFGTYQGRRPQYMDTSVVNGARMAIAHLEVKDPPHVVLEWYRRELLQRGLPVIEGSPKRGMRYLSFRPKGSAQLRTVTLLPKGRGTLILVSIGDPSPMFRAPAQRQFDLPMPNGAGPMITSRQGEAGTQLHGSFEVTGMGPDVVRAFYEAELPRRGYQREAWAEGPPGPVTWRRDREQLTLHVLPTTDPTTARVSILWTRERP